MSFWYFYCQLWTYFTPFPSVSIFEFEQVNGSMGMACFIQCYQILRLLLLERILGADEIFRLTQPELSCLSKIVCLLHKQIQYVFCSFWLYKFLACLLDWLVSWKWAGSVSILTFNHGIAHPRKLDRFFIFAQAPCNQKYFFNKQGVLTWEMGWPTKWPFYTYRRNKKAWPIYQTNPGFEVSLPHIISFLAIQKFLKERFLRYY